MNVTEGKYGDVTVKQETPDRDVTVKQETPDRDTMKYMSSGSRSGTDSDTVEYQMLPSGSGSGMPDTAPQCPTGTLTGNNN